MPKILSGIGQTIGKLFGVEPKPVSDTLEEQINKALAEEKDKIRPSRNDIDTFSWITKDNNPVHRLEGRARKMGFKQIPIMGAHMAAYGEQFIEMVVENMRDYWGANIKIIGQDNSFKEAVGLRDKIHWQVTGYKAIDSEIRLNVSGTVKDTEAIAITSHLGKEYKPRSDISGPINSKKYLLEEDHLNSFYECVGGKNSKIVPNMLPAAYVPASLLALLEEKTQTMEGINLSMNFEFIRKAKLGKLQVDVYPPKKPKEKQRKNSETIDYIYMFKSIVSQDSKPITFGKIISSTPYLTEF
jgi:hypothetical protein